MAQKSSIEFLLITKPSNFFPVLYCNEGIFSLTTRGSCNTLRYKKFLYVSIKIPPLHLFCPFFFVRRRHETICTPRRKKKDHRFRASFCALCNDSSLMTGFLRRLIDRNSGGLPFFSLSSSMGRMFTFNFLRAYPRGSYRLIKKGRKGT